MNHKNVDLHDHHSLQYKISPFKIFPNIYININVIFLNIFKIFFLVEKTIWNFWYVWKLKSLGSSRDRVYTNLNSFGFSEHRKCKCFAVGCGHRKHVFLTRSQFINGKLVVRLLATSVGSTIGYRGCNIERYGLIWPEDLFSLKKPFETWWFRKMARVVNKLFVTKLTPIQNWYFWPKIAHLIINLVYK